jgi:hypothetical protein
MTKPDDEKGVEISLPQPQYYITKWIGYTKLRHPKTLPNTHIEHIKWFQMHKRHQGYLQGDNDSTSSAIRSESN